MWIREEIVGKAFKIMFGMWWAQHCHLLLLLYIALEGEKANSWQRSSPLLRLQLYSHLFLVSSMCQELLNS